MLAAAQDKAGTLLASFGLTDGQVSTLSGAVALDLQHITFDHDLGEIQFRCIEACIAAATSLCTHVQRPCAC